MNDTAGTPNPLRDAGRFNFKNVLLNYSGAEMIEACKAALALSNASADKKLPPQSYKRLEVLTRGLKPKDRYDLTIDEAASIGL